MADVRQRSPAVYVQEAPCAHAGAADTVCTMKTCSKCKELKPLDSFYRSSTGTHGRHGYCKACGVAYSKARHPAAYAANRRREIARATAWQQENADRYRARITGWQRANRAKLLEAKRKDTKKRVDELSIGYVAGCMGLRVAEATPDLLILKREQLSLLRLTKKLKQEIVNQLENENGN